MKIAQFLKQGLQVGPWRITRKILALIITFSGVVLLFGVILLETQAFGGDSDNDDDDDEENDWSVEEEDWYEFGDGISGGDWVVLCIMILAGLVLIASGIACCMSRPNPPKQLDSSGQEGVYSIELNKRDIDPVPERRPSAPNESSWPHIQHQMYQHNLQQHLQQQEEEEQQQQHQQHNNNSSGWGKVPPPKYSSPSAPPPHNPHHMSTITELPPPYSP